MWMIALGGALVLPLATAILPSWRVVPLSAALGERPSVATPSLPRDVRHTTTVADGSRTHCVDPDGSGRAGQCTPRQSARASICETSTSCASRLALWLAGTLVSLIRLVRAHARARAIVRVSRPWIKTTRDGREFVIRQSDLASAPFTYGVFRPTIIVPADAIEWPAARLDAVVNHEAAHVSRDDGVALLLAEVTCAVYWWHPAVRYASRQAAAECERACDDVVLRTGMLASDYGTQLLAQAQAGCAWDARPLATIMFGRSDGLAARIGALLDPRIDRRPLRRSRALSAAVFGVGMVALLAAAAPLEKSVINTPARAMRRANRVDDQRAAGRAALVDCARSLRARGDSHSASAGRLRMPLSPRRRPMSHPLRRRGLACKRMLARRARRDSADSRSPGPVASSPTRAPP